MLEPRTILTLHRIIEIRALPLADLVIKDLFHGNLAVVASALKCLEKLKAENLLEPLKNLFSGSSDEIRLKILDLMRQAPRSEYIEFLSNSYQGSPSDVIRSKILTTLGAQTALGHESIQFLRSKILYQNPVYEERLAALDGLILAKDIDTVVQFALDNIEVTTEQEMVERALRGLKNSPSSSAFQKLLRFWKGYSAVASNQLSVMSRAFLIALFGTYPDDSANQAVFAQVKEKIGAFARSENQEEVLFLMQLLTELDGKDKAFFIRCLVPLVVGKTMKAEIQEAKRKLFLKSFPPILKEDPLQGKNLASLLEKLFTNYTTALDLRRKQKGENQKQDSKALVIEFFESLDHPNLLTTAITALKSNAGENNQNIVLYVLKKLQPSLNQRQKELLGTVLKQLLNEDGRQRSALAVELGKINLEETPQRIARNMIFYSLVAGYVINERLAKLMFSLYESIQILSDNEEARTGICKALVQHGQEASLHFIFKKIAHLPESRLFQIFSEIGVIKLPALNFLKPFFSAKRTNPETFLSAAIDCLGACHPVSDQEWNRILIQIMEQQFGMIAEETREKAMVILSKSCNLASLDVYQKTLRQKRFVLAHEDIQILQGFSQSLKTSGTVDHKEQFRDLLYGAIKDENQSFYAELSALLIQMQEDQGQVILNKVLDSNTPAILCRAVEQARRCEVAELWKKILQLTKQNDFLLHSQIVTYFEKEIPGVNSEELQANIQLLLEGQEITTTFTENLKGTEATRLQKFFTEVRQGRSSTNRAKFELEQNLRELTIFFIDIAGYTKKSATSDISEVMLMLENFSDIIQPIGKKYAGTLIKKIGDCFMYTFDTPLEGVMAALETQSELKKYNSHRVEKDRLNTRIGLNTGKVFWKDNDVYGDPVNVASRVESKAPMNGLLINETTFAGVADFILFQKMDPIQVKGVDKPLQTYHVLGLKEGVMASYKSALNTQQMFRLKASHGS